jgi:hypothetical protein
MNEINECAFGFQTRKPRGMACGQDLRVDVYPQLGNAQICCISECAFDVFQTRTKRAKTRCAFIKWRLREMIKAKRRAFIIS